MTESLDRSGQRLRIYPFGRIFAGCVDIDQTQYINLIKSARKIVVKMFGACVTMRLKNYHQSSPTGFRRRQCGFDLGRMMAIIIDHDNLFLLALDLETSIDT